jgi:hypothetical protein
MFIDAEFAMAVLAALSIPLVIVASLIVMANTSVRTRTRGSRFRLIGRRPFRGIRLRSRPPLPLVVRRPPMDR